MEKTIRKAYKNLVALLAEGVDRNATACVLIVGLGKVALLAEGVDRNLAAA